MEINGILIDSVVVSGVGTNCYIVRRKNEDQCVVVDPGGDGEKIGHWIKEHGLILNHILLTHGHFDHILGVPKLISVAGGKICTLRAEKALLGDAWLNVSQMAGEGIVVKADCLLEDEEIFESADMKFHVFHTPGHTIGSCCYYLEDEQILFSGDTLFRESIGRTDLPTGNGTDIIVSLQQKILTLPESVKVFPGHGPFTDIGYEKANNPYAGM